MLQVGHEHLGLGAGLESLLHVAHDADDFEGGEVRRGLGAELDALPHGIDIREVLPRQALVDHDHGRGALPVAIVDEPPAPEWHTQRGQVRGRDGAVARHDVVVRPTGRHGFTGRMPTTR